MITTKELELRRLIYGQSHIIVIDESESYRCMVKQIEMVKNTMSIEGFIFKPDFATTAELKAFTDEDWLAMLAQYAITYSWQNEYKNIFNDSALNVMQNYMNKGNNKLSTALAASNTSFTVKTTQYYWDLLMTIAQSKTPLRQQQISILNLMPIYVVEDVFEKANFTIKEIEIMFIKILFNAGSDKVSLRTGDQVLRFVVAVFNINDEINTKFNKEDLKHVKVKVPTSMKKKLLTQLDKIRYDKLILQMHPYRNFWKRLLKQLSYMPLEKMSKKYPNVFAARALLYSENYTTINSIIEQYKVIGNYSLALKAEMQNPGQMMRNLLQYLRYRKGDAIARKCDVNSKILANMLIKPSGRVVKKDAKKVLKSNKFAKALMSVNTKLLWQILGLIDTKKYHESMNIRKVNNKIIAYDIALPPLDKELSIIAKKQIKKAIKKIKKEQNKDLGKIYISSEVAKYVIQYSGREDTSTSLSGEYLYPGSRLDVKELLKKGNKLLRVGLAWRGHSSCDIDVSLNVKDHGAVYYNNNSLSCGSAVGIASSGDITSCSSELFSVELMDIDVDTCLDCDIAEMFTSAIIYSGESFSNYECYWFISVIDKKDRVIAGRRVHINLDEMDFATQITTDKKGIIGHKINLKEGFIEVLNIASSQLQNGMSAEIAENIMTEAINNMSKRQEIADALKMVVTKKQLTKKIKKANIVISTVDPKNDKVEWIHPGRNNDKLQEILF